MVDKGWLRPDVVLVVVAWAEPRLSQTVLSRAINMVLCRNFKMLAFNS